MRFIGVRFMMILVGTVPVLAAAPCLHAQGIPTIDVQSVIQGTLTAARALEQVQKLAQQYEKQVEQLTVAYQQRDALLGARGLGQLLNGPGEQAARRTTPATLEALLQMAQTGKGPSSAAEVRRFLEQLQTDLALPRPETVHVSDRDTPAARLHRRTQDTALSSLAVAQSAYDGVPKHVAAYERMIAEIDRTPDLKASSDLNARLAAENGLAMAELIRLQALLLSSISTRSASELATRGNLSQIAGVSGPGAPRPGVEGGE
jgi:type IV secretion system protein VirB5